MVDLLLGVKVFVRHREDTRTQHHARLLLGCSLVTRAQYNK